MTINIDTLAAAFRARGNTPLRWDTVSYAHESHDSVVIKSYYDALRMVFARWSPPRDPQTNLLQVSLADLKAHYAAFGDQLGDTQRPPEEIVNELGYQFLNIKDLDRSLEAFRFNAELYPRRANVWDSLADALEAAGKADEARASCRRAISLAEANSDSRLERFRNHLSRLSTSVPPK